MLNKKIIKDKKYRLTFNFNEKKKIIYKYLCYNLKISNFQKKISQLLLLNITRNSSITFIRNRCIFTGRGRAVLSTFKVSRREFKRLSNSGFFSNTSKK